MDKEVIFNEFPKNLYAALESEQGGIADDWRVRFREYFLERYEAFC